MRRRLFNLAAIVSVALCVTTVVIWVRGRSDPQLVWFRTAEHLYYINVESGRLEVDRFDLRETRTQDGPIATGITLGSIPLWPVVLISSLLPLVWVRRENQAWRRLRWRKSGRSRECGYDLRATPGRCPECGTTPAPFKQHAAE